MMSRRSIAIVIVGAPVALAVSLAIRARGQVAEVGLDDASAAANGPGLAQWDDGPIVGTVHDRKTREELRRKILDALAAPADDDVSERGREGRQVEPATTRRSTPGCRRTSRIQRC